MRIGRARSGRTRQDQRPCERCQLGQHLARMLVGHDAKHDRQMFGMRLRQIRRQRLRAGRVVRAVDENRPVTEGDTIQAAGPARVAKARLDRFAAWLEVGPEADRGSSCATTALPI